MTRTRPSLAAALTVVLFTPVAFAADAAETNAPKLEQVAQFEHQVTGVTVSKDGRIFVNFRVGRKTRPSASARSKGGSVVPYPDGAWNNWRNEKGMSVDPSKYFVCVQSVVVGPGGDKLWVVDAAAPGQGPVVKNGPKLVKIDLATNQVEQVLPMGEHVALTASYLNDIRFSPDGKFAYLTDSGGKGALIVVDLASGKARRVLDGHPSTQVEPDVVVQTDRRPLRRPDGRPPLFAADGIAISEDGKTLYWQALTGKTLYKIGTDVLSDMARSPDDVAKAVENVGENGPSDGLIIDGHRLYISAMEEDAIKVRDLNGDAAAKPTIVIQTSGSAGPTRSRSARAASCSSRRRGSRIRRSSTRRHRSRCPRNCGRSA